MTRMVQLQRPITPTAPTVQQISTGLTPVRTVTPVQRPATLYVLRRPQKETGFTNYNDPDEINSMADVITNSITGAFKDMKNGTYVPLKNTVSNLVEYGNNVFYKPIKAGNMTALGLNLLSGLGETLDLVDNGAKGIILGGIEGAKKDGSFLKGATEGFLDAYGLRGNGRKNWDADTGNFFTDVVAEVLMSPSTWLTLGTSALVKSSAKELGEVFTKEAMQKINKELSEETKQYVTKRAVKAYATGAAPDIATALKKELNTIATSKTPLTFLKTAEGDDLSKITKEVKETASLMQNIETTYQSNKVLDAVSKLTRASDAVDNAINTLAFNSTLIPPAFKFVSGALSKWSTIGQLNKYKTFESIVKTANGTIDTFKYSDVKDYINKEVLTAQVLDGTIKNAEGSHANTLKNLLTRSLNKDYYTVNSLYLKNKDNPEKFLEEVQKVLSIPEGKTFSDYIENLRLISEDNPGLEDIIDKFINLGQDIKTDSTIKNFQDTYTRDTKIKSFVADSYNALKDGFVQAKLAPEDLIDGKATKTTFFDAVDRVDKLYTNKALALHKAAREAHDPAKLLTDDHAYSLTLQLEKELTSALDRALADFEVYGRSINPKHGVEFMNYHSNLNRMVSELRMNALDEIELYASNYRMYLESIVRNPKNVGTLEAFNYKGIIESINKIKDTANAFVKNLEKTPPPPPALKEALKPHKDTFDKMLRSDKNAQKVRDRVISLASKSNDNLKVGFSYKYDNAANNKTIAQIKDSIKTVFGDAKKTESTTMANDLHKYIKDFVRVASSNKSTPDEYINAWQEAYNALLETRVLKYRAEGTSEFLDDTSYVEEFIELMKDVAPESYLRTEVQVTGETVLYALKQEQAYSLLSIMSNMDMIELHKAVYDNGGIGAYINHLAELDLPKGDVLYEASQIARSIKSHLEYYTNVQSFLNKLAGLPIDVQVKEGFISSIQKFATYKLSDLTDNFDYVFDELMKSTEAHVYSRNMEESLKLDVFRANNPEVMEAVEKAPQLQGRKGHDALYDVYTEEAYIKEKGFMEKYFNDPNKNYVTFDIETLNERVFEIGLKPLGRDGAILNRTLEAGTAADTPTTELLALFDTTLDRFFTEKQPLVPTTEKQMYEQFIAKLYELNLEKPVELIGHNIDEFDTPLIIKRMEDLKVDKDAIEFFKSLTKHDSLNYAKLENGAKPIYGNDRALFKETLAGYVKALEEVDNAKLLLQPVSGNLLTDLNQLGSILYQLKAIKGNSLENVIGNAGMDVFMAATQLKSYAGSLSNAFREIKNNNTILSRIFINNDIFTPGSDFMTKYAELLKNAGLKPTGDYLNITKALYTGQGEGLNMLGAKTVMNSKKILSWYKIEDGDYLDINVARRLTRQAYTLEKIRKNVYLPKHLDEISFDLNPNVGIKGSVLDYVVNALSVNRKVISDSDFENIFKVGTTEQAFVLPSLPSELKYLKTDVDRLTEYAYLQHIYNVLKRKAETAPKTATTTRIVQPNATLKGVRQVVPAEMQTVKSVRDVYKDAFERFKELLSQDLLDTLEDPASITRRGSHSPKHMVKDINDINEHVANPKALNRISERFKKDVNSLYELSDLFDSEGFAMFRGKAQAMSSMLAPVQNLIDNFNKFLGDTPEVRMNNLEKVRAYTNDLRITQTLQQLSLRDDDLLSFMLHEAPWFEFAKKDVLTDPAFENAYTEFVASLGSNKGLIDVAEVGDRVYVYLTKDAYTKFSHQYDAELGAIKWSGEGKQLTRPQLKQLEVISDELDDTLKQNLLASQGVLTTLSEGRSVGSSFETFALEDLVKLYDQLPTEVVSNMPDINTLGHKELWKAPRFNYVNIGSTNSRALKNKYTTHNVVGAIKTSSEQAVVKAKNHIVYTSYYYAPDFSINLSPAFSDPAYDDEILQAFKDNPEYVLSALVEDSRIGYRAIKIDVTSKAALQEARRLNAILLPRHTFQELADSINRNMLSDLKGNFFSKLMYTYKMGYLLSPGTMLRNYVDSTFKTMISTGSNLFEVIKAQKEGSQMLSSYDIMVSNIMSMASYEGKAALKMRKELFDQANNQLAKEQAQAAMTIAKMELAVDDIQQKILKMDKYKKYTVENERFYFEKLRLPSELDYETYKYIDGLVKDGWGAGQTSAWRGYTSEIINSKIGETGSAGDKMWNMFVQGMNKLMTPNTKIEQWNRMGQYVLLSKAGTPNTKAFMEIVKTHFDYGDKTRAQLIAEYIFPFYTYTMKNLEYWFDIVENNPKALSMLEDVLTPTLNLDEYDYEELSKNRSLQYQIMSGAIPLYDVNNSTFTLKLSPSALDAFKLAYNPLGEMSEKVFGPYKSLTGVATDNEGIFGFGADAGVDSGQSGLNFALEQLPVIGTLMQRYGETGQRNYGRTGNILNAILPDVFGATARFEDFSKKPKLSNGGKGRSYTRKAYVRKPRRVYTKQKRYASKTYSRRSWIPRKSYSRRSYGKKVYAHNVYAKRTYADRTYAKRTYANKEYNSWVYPNAVNSRSIYKKNYTKQGKSRFKSLLLPTSPSRLRYHLINFNMLYR